MGKELFHANKRTEGQTDRHMTKQKVTFAILRTRLKKGHYLCSSWNLWLPITGLYKLLHLR